jgi:methyl-accepting chemotaxis protein
LEEFPATKIEWTGTRPVVRYRDQILPLVDVLGLLPSRPGLRGLDDSILVKGVEAQTPRLTNSSAELSAVSQQISASAEETSAEANLVATAADQISRHVEMVANSYCEMERNSKTVARRATEAASGATEGVRMAFVTHTSVAKLGESSGNIGSVVKAIASIAEQTNLLALNATIEVARAGEAGKGFAVVANEVKELAKQTARGTEEIGQRIGTIQQDISCAVSTIGQVGTIINRISGLQTGIASAVESHSTATTGWTRFCDLRRRWTLSS